VIGRIKGDYVYKPLKSGYWHMVENLAKVSISVDPAVVAWMDKQIEKRVYRNRSHAFDVAGHLLMETVEKMTPAQKGQPLK
jgi:metal-responsive CopG/Arc/MetJ family transcriptional regulator